MRNVASEKNRLAFPHRLPYHTNRSTDARVAQPGRASPCQGECRGFESLLSLQFLPLIPGLGCSGIFQGLRGFESNFSSNPPVLIRTDPVCAMASPVSTSLPDDLRIRLAVRADCEGILAIYNDAVLRTTASYDEQPRTLGHRLEWFDAHERDGYPVWVAVIGADEVVGWSALNRFHDRVGYRFTCENSIYIAEPWRGRGLGALLLQPLIRSAEERSLHGILAVIDAENVASIRLHERHGFTRVGHFKDVGFKFGRWLDVVYLQRLIPLRGAARAPSRPDA